MNYNRTKAKKRILVYAFALGCFLIGACGQQTIKDNTVKGEAASKPSSGFTAATPDTYDSADTAILIGINEEEKTLQFYNFDVNKSYTLSYDGTTRFSDKYDTSVALSQIKVGELVDVTFLKRTKHLTAMNKAKSGWVLESVEEYSWDRIKDDITIGKEIYQVSAHIQCFSNNARIAEDEISTTDVITLFGIDSTVLGILVERGHGFLRLENEDYFIGGWIEIGNKLIQKITTDMCITVPEGLARVVVSNNGNSGVKEVIINRNAETVVDVGDIEIAQPKTGKVIFSLVPDTTSLYVDGTRVDTSTAVELEYGLHQLIASNEGYETITKYIRVGQESAGVEIVMEEKVATDDDDEEEEESSATAEEAVSTYYKVYVDSPSDVEVYLDNAYVGISPCSFEKKAGTHVITLRKTGYTTKSITVNFTEEERDLSYSFADLTEVSDSSLTTAELIEQIWDNILSE